MLGGARSASRAGGGDPTSRLVADRPYVAYQLALMCVLHVKARFLFPMIPFLCAFAGSFYSRLCATARSRGTTTDRSRSRVRASRSAPRSPRCCSCSRLPGPRSTASARADPTRRHSCMPCDASVCCRPFAASHAPAPDRARPVQHLRGAARRARAQLPRPHLVGARARDADGRVLARVRPDPEDRRPGLSADAADRPHGLAMDEIVHHARRLRDLDEPAADPPGAACRRSCFRSCRCLPTRSSSSTSSRCCWSSSGAPAIRRTWRISRLPLVFVAVFLVAAGAGFVVAAIVPLLPDLRFVIEQVLTVVMFLSGVVFSLKAVPSPLSRNHGAQSDRGADGGDARHPDARRMAELGRPDARSAVISLSRAASIGDLGRRTARAALSEARDMSERRPDRARERRHRVRRATPRRRQPLLGARRRQRHAAPRRAPRRDRPQRRRQEHAAARDRRHPRARSRPRAPRAGVVPAAVARARLHAASFRTRQRDPFGPACSAFAAATSSRACRRSASSASSANSSNSRSRRILPAWSCASRSRSRSRSSPTCC